MTTSKDTGSDTAGQAPRSAKDEEREADRAAHDALSSINSDQVIDDPGDPEAADPESPASDTEAPPPL